MPLVIVEVNVEVNIFFINSNMLCYFRKINIFTSQDNYRPKITIDEIK